MEFVPDPCVQPTDNAVGRGLREIVVHRKIRGTLRFGESMENFANIFTCVATRKNRGIDYLAETGRYAQTGLNDANTYRGLKGPKLIAVVMDENAARANPGLVMALKDAGIRFTILREWSANTIYSLGRRRDRE